MRTGKTLLALLLTVSCVFMGCAGEGLDQELTDAVRDYSNALPVVPGIEGFGIDTSAGRGGHILRVTNLNARGAGSLRAALETPGPRVVLFEVGGVLELTEALVVSEPHATIAGETAPSPGLTIIGAGMVVKTHDVLVRHLRFRVGDRPEGPHPDDRDGISVYASGNPNAPTRNVVIDHCSIAWAVDEGMSNWGRDVADITYSRCIIAENLSRSIHPKGEHSKGILVGDNARRAAIIGNLFAHNMERNPFIKGNVSALIANNLIYNPGTAAIHFGDYERSGPSLGAVLGNTLIPGPDTRRLLPLVRLQLDLHPDARVYAFNNNSGGRAMMRSLWACGAWRPAASYDAMPVRVRPLTTRAPEDTVGWVLHTAGARPRERDHVDQRIVEAVRSGTGRIIDSIAQVGGFPVEEPTYRALTPPEAPHERVESGYTRLETWLFEFAAALE